MNNHWRRVRVQRLARGECAMIGFFLGVAAGFAIAALIFLPK